MGPAVLSRVASTLCMLTVLCACVAHQARGSTPPETTLDAAALTDLEARAAAAEPRDRCFLYTELLHDWTELAGHAMAQGDDAAADLAVQHADADAARLADTIARDSKRLKNAELLMEHTVHRLSDMLRVASMDQHDTLQAVLRHANSVHDELLAAVFTH